MSETTESTEELLALYLEWTSDHTQEDFINLMDKRVLAIRSALQKAGLL